MSSDERIEALAQSVELLSRMHQDNEIRFQGYMDRLTSVVETLALIVQGHESRIRRIEGPTG